MAFFHVITVVNKTDILRVLIEAGTDGLQVRKIARHVYNASNTFFSDVSFESVYISVSQYLNRESKRRNPLVVKVSRGVYAANLLSAEVQRVCRMLNDEIPDDGTSSHTDEPMFPSFF